MATKGNAAKAAELTKNATAYNRQLHPNETILAKRLAEQSEGRFTVEDMEDALRLSSAQDKGLYANTDMVVSAEGVYDTGGKWILGGDGRSFVQLLPEANVEAVRFVAKNTSGYAWDNRSLGVLPELSVMKYPLEIPGCISCAAGLPYSLNTVDMRTPTQIDADQRAFTLGVSSLAGLPVSAAGLLTSYGVRPVILGAGLGSGFDAVGQSVSGGEYRPGQNVVAGVTGGLAAPFAGGATANFILGGTVGGVSQSINNNIYSETKSIPKAALFGGSVGLLGTYAGNWASKISGALLPDRVGAAVIDPAKPIILQNIGVANPYPAYIGEASGELVSGGIPILIDKLWEAEL